MSLQRNFSRYATLLFFYLFFIPTFLYSMTSEQFIAWWKQYQDSPKIPLELKEMEEYFVQSGLIQYSSQYWNHLNKQNIEQITVYGYENFKQTVTRNYFTWVVNIDNPYAANLRSTRCNIQLPKKEINKVHPLFTADESFRYNFITLYFLNYMINIGAGPYLEKLEEPLIGNPPYLTYNEKRVSQDIFNSLLEYLSIAQHCPLQKISTIIEVGAGSGRTAFCFISLQPHIKYIIVDFPPALYISQKYLSEVFSTKKVMRFRPFDRFEEIAKEYTDSQIIFLTPDQLKKLPDHTGDLFLAIDCLHEMRPEMVISYFNEADRLCSYFYFKCWQSTVIPYDNISYSSDYSVPSSWKLLFKEPCIVPSDFFHAFYEIQDGIKHSRERE